MLRPLPLTVVDWTEADEADEQLEAPRHPKKDFGVRPLRFGSDLVIERTDFHDLQEGEPPKGFNRLVEGGRVRLRYAYVVKCDSVERDDPDRSRDCYVRSSATRARRQRIRSKVQGHHSLVEERRRRALHCEVVQQSVQGREA